MNIINRLVEVTILALNVNIMFSIILHHLPLKKVRKILRKTLVFLERRKRIGELYLSFIRYCDNIRIFIISKLKYFYITAGGAGVNHAGYVLMVSLSGIQQSHIALADNI